MLVFFCSLSRRASSSSSSSQTREERRARAAARQRGIYTQCGAPRRCARTPACLQPALYPCVFVYLRRHRRPRLPVSAPCPLFIPLYLCNLSLSLYLDTRSLSLSDVRMCMLLASAVRIIPGLYILPEDEG